jgi:hypothetical protein
MKAGPARALALTALAVAATTAVAAPRAVEPLLEGAAEWIATAEVDGVGDRPAEDAQGDAVDAAGDATGSTPAEVDAGSGASPQARQVRTQPSNFYFARVMYGGGGGFRGSRWATDFPEADQWIVGVLSRLTYIDAFPREYTVRLDDPNLRRYPFIYAVEVGSMGLSPAEVQGLRDYLLAGGFLFVDDFWGTNQWWTFEREIRRVLPEFEIVQIPMDHPVFSTFYEIEEIIQVPVVDQGIRGGPTHEQDGYVPYCLGIFDDRGRLMVVINWNTDLGDAWEHAEDPRYPLRYSTFAYQMAANFIVYAMSR